MYPVMLTASTPGFPSGAVPCCPECYTSGDTEGWIRCIAEENREFWPDCRCGGMAEWSMAVVLKTDDAPAGGRLMGTVYRRKVRICRTCDARLNTTAARRACETAGHVLVVEEQPIWWLLGCSHSERGSSSSMG